MSIKLTKDEIKNGWTVEALEKYHREREKSASQKVLEPRKVKPVSQKSYNPLRWRE